MTISGANDTGIFAENNSGLIVENDTIQGNGINPGPGIISFGGVVLAGEDDAAASANTVINNGGGGFFVNDNGPVDPGTSTAGIQPLTPATDNTVSGNTISGNYGNCGIVYATHNSGGSITGGGIADNTITGHVGVFHATGPDVGGIVVATASAGATLSNVPVTDNTVSGSFEGGIIVHSHAPHDVVTGVTITGNTVGPNNNWGQTNGPPTTAGIIVGVDQLPPALAADHHGHHGRPELDLGSVLRDLDQRGHGHHDDPRQHDQRAAGRYPHLHHADSRNRVLAGGL